MVEIAKQHGEQIVTVLKTNELKISEKKQLYFQKVAETNESFGISLGKKEL